MRIRSKSDKQIKTDIKVFKSFSNNSYKNLSIKKLHTTFVNKNRIEYAAFYEMYLKIIRDIRREYKELMPDDKDIPLEKRIEMFNKNLLKLEKNDIGEKHSPRAIINRDYQEYIVKRLLENDNNYGVHLPTSAGKTIVFFKLIIAYLENNLIEDDQLIIITAPTNDLVKQHQNLLKNSFPEIDKSKITISTPHTILNKFLANEINEEDIGLLIVDEAHKGAGIYYDEEKKQESKYPSSVLSRELQTTRIIAFTASPTSKKIMEKLMRIPKNNWLSPKNIAIAADLEQYMKNTRDINEKVRLPDEVDEALSPLKNKISNNFNLICKLNFIPEIFTLKADDKFLKIRPHQIDCWIFIADKILAGDKKTFNIYKGYFRGTSNYDLKNRLKKFKSQLKSFKGLLYYFQITLSDNFFVLIEKFREVERKYFAKLLIEGLEKRHSGVKECIYEELEKFKSNRQSIHQYKERIMRFLGFLNNNKSRFVLESDHLRKIDVLTRQLIIDIKYAISETPDITKSSSQDGQLYIEDIDPKTGNYLIELSENLYKYIKFFDTINFSKTSSNKNSSINYFDSEIFRLKFFRNTVKNLLKLEEKDISHPKIEKLIEIVKSDDLKGSTFLISVYDKKSILPLKLELEKIGFKVGYLIGGSKQNKVIELNNEATIKAANEKQLDIVIGTNVTDEGMDIGFDVQIDLNLSSSQKQDIQRKGRCGRRKNGYRYRIIMDHPMSYDQEKFDNLSNRFINSAPKEDLNEAFKNDSVFRGQFLDKINNNNNIPIEKFHEVFRQNNSEPTIIKGLYKITKVSEQMSKIGKKYLWITIIDQTDSIQLPIFSIPKKKVEEYKQMILSNLNNDFYICLSLNMRNNHISAKINYSKSEPGIISLAVNNKDNIVQMKEIAKPVSINVHAPAPRIGDKNHKRNKAKSGTSKTYPGFKQQKLFK